MNYNNKLLWAAILVAPAITLTFWLLAGTPYELPLPTKTRTLLLVILLVPLCEEIVFRGLLQNELASYERLRQTVLGLSWDNLITSTLFTLVHVLYFSSAWVILIQIPALITGFFYSRHRRLIYPILLHAWYNTNGLVAYSLL